MCWINIQKHQNYLTSKKKKMNSLKNISRTLSRTLAICAVTLLSFSPSCPPLLWCCLVRLSEWRSSWDRNLDWSGMVVILLNSAMIWKSTEDSGRMSPLHTKAEQDSQGGKWRTDTWCAIRYNSNLPVHTRQSFFVRETCGVDFTLVDNKGIPRLKCA